nr:immunoglobulin light chain junction region [Macaca mulatta]MOV78664.1 immunoglobulin light chain junction region [Macaca mulatta]MOV78952.1 immunoglobulin light chain junction region [Macaca mulatta]MOV79486.1 immunoglobulin light chain junction region [Macaca mulatta]MOV79503.1 immunoglobulin light chain junction region [Macaca mulatta]
CMQALEFPPFTF